MKQRSKAHSSGGLGITCPHCNMRALQRRTVVMSPLVREKVYRCTNDECGHVFITIEEIQRTVVPPRVLNPSINLPLSKLHSTTEPTE